MTVPIVPGKYGKEGTIKPYDILAQNNPSIDKTLIPTTCLLCPSGFPLAHIKKTQSLREGPTIIKPLFVTEDDIGVFSHFVGFGAPMWAWVLEQLIALGIKNFIYVGFFGSVNPSAHPTKWIVPPYAVRDEGTSYHYSPTEVQATADNILLSHLATAKTTQLPVWTTDAMFRQTQADVDEALRLGIAGFDMELAALYIIAKAKGCRLASIQIMSDSFEKGRWHSHYGSEEFDQTFAEAVNHALGVLKCVR